MTEKKAVKSDTKTKPLTLSVERKQREIEITESMTSMIQESLVKINENSISKAQAAREAYDVLQGLERRQLVYVFMEGCKLSRAGAETYYQNCRNHMKKSATD